MLKVIYKYNFKKSFNIVKLILIGVGVLFAIGRWWSVFDNEFIMVSESFHYSISNLSLSLLFYLAIGQAWLKFGQKFYRIAVLGLFIIASNFICETLMGFMNTTDILDAIYGTIGTVTAFVFLFFTNKYGLIPVDTSDKDRE